MVPVFKNVRERSTAKNYCPVSLLFVVRKFFEKLANNRIVNHQDKCSLFSDFEYGFRSSRSTADLLTSVSDRIARALTTTDTDTEPFTGFAKLAVGDFFQLQPVEGRPVYEEHKKT